MPQFVRESLHCDDMASSSGRLRCSTTSHKEWSARSWRGMLSQVFLLQDLDLDVLWRLREDKIAYSFVCALEDVHRQPMLWGVENATNLRVSRRLVNGRLIRAGYRARRPVRKPLLQQSHRQRHLQWARQHARLTPQHWTHVVFSDDARFEVYRHDGRIRVRRRVEVYHESCILPRVQAGGGGVTVWCI